MWRIRVDHGSTVSCKMWPGLVKEMGTIVPTKCENLVESAIIRQCFAPCGRHDTPIQIKLSCKHRPLHDLLLHGKFSTNTLCMLTNFAAAQQRSQFLVLHFSDSNAGTRIKVFLDKMPDFVTITLNCQNNATVRECPCISHRQSSAQYFHIPLLKFPDFSPEFSNFLIFQFSSKQEKHFRMNSTGFKLVSCPFCQPQLVSKHWQ